MHLRRLITPIVWIAGSTFLAASPLRAERVDWVAGGGTRVTGAAVYCRLHAPFGLDSDRAGNLYIVEMAGGERVLRVDRHGRLTIVAGTGDKGNSGDGGLPTAAHFNGSHSLALGPDNVLFIADTWNNRVRQIDLKKRRISAFAGTGVRGFAGDGGPGGTAQFGGVYCVALDSRRQNMYLADLDNRRIRRVNLKTGVVTTVAGNGEKGVPVDGSIATRAPLVDPRAVAADSQGNVYILERSGHALRVVDRQGRIRTVAGTGEKGFSGDGGPARKAQLNGPKHICVDANDNVIIADTDNHVIRKYLPKQDKVIRLVGTGRSGSNGVGGPPQLVELNQPHGVHVDRAGTLYIVDSLNNRVLKLVR